MPILHYFWAEAFAELDRRYLDESWKEDITTSEGRKEIVLNRPEVNDANLLHKYRLGIYESSEGIDRLQVFDFDDESEEKKAASPLGGLTITFLYGPGEEQGEGDIAALVKASGGDFVSFRSLDSSKLGEVDVVLTDCLLHPPHVAMADPGVVDGMKKIKAHGTVCCDVSWLKSTILKRKQEEDFR